MFACIYGAELPDSRRALLLECARRYSPHVEDSALDAVILDAGGSSSLFGSPRNIAHQIARSASELGLKVNIAIASNPDAAFHAARGFPGISVIPPGKEAEFLGGLPLEILSPLLAGIDDSRALKLNRHSESGESAVSGILRLCLRPASRNVWEWKASACKSSPGARAIGH